MKNKKIFISGGAGVIGLELVQILVKCGAIVMVGDLKPRPSCFSNKVIYIQGDLNLIDDILSKDIDDIYLPEGLI